MVDVVFVLATIVAAAALVTSLRLGVGGAELLAVTRGTGSLRSCLGFLWFCWRHNRTRDRRDFQR